MKIGVLYLTLKDIDSRLTLQPNCILITPFLKLICHTHILMTLLTII